MRTASPAKPPDTEQPGPPGRREAGPVCSLRFSVPCSVPVSGAVPEERQLTFRAVSSITKDVWSDESSVPTNLIEMVWPM